MNWQIIEIGGQVRGTFTNLNDALTLANVITNIERKRVVFVGWFNGRIVEVMQF